MSAATPALDRRDVVARLLADRGDLLVVAGLGSATYDCAAAGDDPRNFYLWGAMGGTAPLALGLALAQPIKPVLGITGDGDILMGLGALSTIGAQAPANLSIVVLDNEMYGETGAQPTATAHGTDLTAIASASGMNTVDEITDMAGVDALAARLHAGGGPLFANIKIALGEAEKVLPSRDGAYLRSRFREAVLGEAP
jgi:thiamine pyrophosphate-dependent acetolactate synthase large subunit-like protein